MVDGMFLNERGGGGNDKSKDLYRVFHGFLVNLQANLETLD